MWRSPCVLPSRSALKHCFAILPRKAYKAAPSQYEPKCWRQEINGKEPADFAIRHYTYDTEG